MKLNTVTIGKTNTIIVIITDEKWKRETQDKNGKFQSIFLSVFNFF